MDTSERRKRASSEATDWFTRLQAGEMERAEREQLVEWLRESHIHVTEMLRIAQIHGELKHFEHWARVSTGPKAAADNVVELPSPSDANSLQVKREASARDGKGEGLQRPLLVFLALSASVALMVATVFVLPRIRGQVIETERGECREVVLSDGSVLRVDPETWLRVKYSDEVRRVFLERGRALFRVTKNIDRPFFVKADETTVRAVGTAFGVEQQTRGIVVTVAEGKVAIDSPSTSASIPLQLTANQQVTVPRRGAVDPVREVDSQRALAWAEGRLIFQNDELGKVLAEFNRYNRVQLYVANSALATKPVSGVFNASDPQAFIAFLQSVTALEIERDGDRSITIGRADP